MLSRTQTPAVYIGNLDSTSEEPENADNTGRRPRRSAALSGRGVNGYGKGGAHIEGYNSVDEMESDEDDASEQDYGDDEDEEEHISLGSDANDQDNFTDAEDELLEEVKQKSLVVKLPVKTPTPEKKSNVQSRPEPKQGPLQPINLPSTNNNGYGKGHTATQQPASISAAPEIGNTAQPTSSFMTTSTARPFLTEPSTESASAPVKGSLDPSPPSPLALRGSPEKPHSFTPPINVGYGGA